MPDFSAGIGSQRAIAHAASQTNSETLLAASRYRRKHAIDDIEDRLVRLERVARALGALLKEHGISEDRVEAKARDLIRKSILGDSVGREPLEQ